MRGAGEKRSEQRESLDDHLYTRHERLLAQKATLVAKLTKLEARHSALTRTGQTRDERNNIEDSAASNLLIPSFPFRADDETDALYKWGVKPSTETAERKLLVRMFMPFIEVEKLSMAHDQTVNGAPRIGFNFTIVLPLLFEVSLGLVYGSESKVLDQIVWTDSDTQIAKLHLLSSQHCDAITRNYIPAKRIDLIIYGLDKMAEALHRRVSTFHEIRKKFGAILLDGRKDAELPQDEADSKVFNELGRILALDFRVNYNDEQQRVSLEWIVGIDISLANSTVCITLKAHNARTKQMKNLDLYFHLLQEPYGVVGALTIIFQRMFGIEASIRQNPGHMVETDPFSKPSEMLS